MSETYAGGISVAGEFIPARWRRLIYAAASLFGYALSAVAVGFAAAAEETPSWVGVSLAVLGFLMGPLAQLAASNTPVPGSATADIEPEV
jgi:hypothetical protein